jgi:hypothetical protein
MERDKKSWIVTPYTNITAIVEPAEWLSRYNLLHHQRDYPDLLPHRFFCELQHEGSRHSYASPCIPGRCLKLFGAQSDRTHCHQQVAQGDDSVVYNQDQQQRPDPVCPPSQPQSSPSQRDWEGSSASGSLGSAAPTC